MSRTMPRRVLTRLLSVVLLPLLAPTAFGQVSLPGSGTYLESFDGIGGGLPTGWTARIVASGTSLGLDAGMGFQPSATSWGTQNGQFANYASALNPGADGTQMSGTQAAYTDRAFGVRQSGQFGDPGAAFTLQLANTAGFQDFNLSFSTQLLNVQTRNTTYTVRYGVGAAPASFTTLGTIDTGTLNGGAFGEDPFSVGPGSLAGINNVNDTVWIQVVALTSSAGGGSRDVFAIDNFQLTYTPVPEPATVLAVGAAGLGLAGLVRRRYCGGLA
jgi:hypothetical protein